jgi:hypothetical protein
MPSSVFHLNIAFPWLRLMRLKSTSLDLELATGRLVSVPLVWASCGVMGERMRLECPLCGRRACSLYHLDGTVACRHCNNLWYAAQRISSTARKFLSKRKIRRKLGDYGQVPSARLPPKPRGMWRRTYAAIVQRWLASSVGYSFSFSFARQRTCRPVTARAHETANGEWVGRI